jgi:hypothetical protein
VTIGCLRRFFVSIRPRYHRHAAAKPALVLFCGWSGCLQTKTPVTEVTGVFILDNPAVRAETSSIRLFLCPASDLRRLLSFGVLGDQSPALIFHSSTGCTSGSTPGFHRALHPLAVPAISFPTHCVLISWKHIKRAQAVHASGKRIVYVYRGEVRRSILFVAGFPGFVRHVTRCSAVFA